MPELTFKKLFFRLYDRKISSGEVSFSQLGIGKSDFTRLCTEDNFVFDDDTIARISCAMKLTDEENAQLVDAAQQCRKKDAENV
ncbi:MAG: hypothetical protein SO251_03125 [Candidatus Fimisoma sp.]|nr:hypothetical protein [Bacillota bacterium]MDD7285352.1 hypothetical protein [Bacillota bacterium]MDY4747773.1 hypothetical protein [Candidatus Fimisoma sp.]